MRPLVLGAVVALLSVACGSSSNDAKGTGGGAGAGGTGGAAGAGGTGGVSGAGGSAGAAGASWSCSLPSPCNTVDITVTGPSLAVSQSADTDCFFTSLRDRKIGHYATSQQSAYYSTSVLFDLLADGTVMRWGISADDTGKSSKTPPSHQELQDAAFFDGCLATQSDVERYQCLVGFTLGAAPGDPICPSP